MCPPTHFDIDYKIDPWMAQAGRGSVDRARAQRQWASLVAQVQRSRHVDFLEAVAGAPDMCFTANAGFVRGRDVVRSNFKCTQRRVEEMPFADWFCSRSFTCHALPRQVNFEGAGDAVLDIQRQRLWMGHGMRSDIEAASWLHHLLDVEVVPLRLVDARFYHLDTCFCILSDGRLVYFPPAFDEHGIAAIEAAFAIDSRIAIGATDARNYACNMIDLGDRVLLASASPSLQEALAAGDIDVVFVEMDEFIKAGGSARSLTLPFIPPLSLLKPSAST